jgi:hypothetical protein
MQLPDEIPAHQLLTPGLARAIYARLVDVAKTAKSAGDDEVVTLLDLTSQELQQTVVDFVQAEIERAERNGRPFRLVARKP